jgi:C4-dicarboxylate-specific signal transduction histidine kinase
MIAHRIEPLPRSAESALPMDPRPVHHDKLATIGALATGVIHELVQPMSGLYFLAEDARRRLPADAPIRPHLDEMLEHLDRMKDIIHGLRVFSRRSARRQPLDLRDAVEKAVRLVRYEFRSYNVVVDIDLGEQPAPVRAGLTEIQQVLINLLLNARDALVEVRRRPGRIRVTLRARGPDIELSVRDNGPGIAPEHKRRLFEPFFTTKGPDRGTGLGLAISRGIVESLGGRITVTSRRGRGATFRVRLPAAASGTGRGPTARRAA